MKILSNKAKWWKGIEKEWACQDKEGNWWIYRNKKDKTSMKMPDKKRMSQRSLVIKPEAYIIIVLSIILGVSLGINLSFLL